MQIRTQILEPDSYYHVFNRGINRQIIFLNDDNYLFFMKQAKHFLKPVLELYAYCLMPNHYHFLIKVKSEKDLNTFIEMQIKKSSSKDGLHSKEKIVSKQFAKFFSSYTQAFNKQHNRKGTLLDSPFKRLKIESETYLKNLIVYIHQNPKEIVDDFRDYRFSSYLTIISNSNTSVSREEVIDLFEDVENFKYVHNNIAELDI